MCILSFEGREEICTKDTTPEDLSVEGELILHGY